MTRRRNDPADTPGAHDEFWGEQTEWTPQRPPSTERAGLSATLGRWWNAFLGGGAVAERAHGRSAAPSSMASSPSGDTDQLVRTPLVDRRLGRSQVADHHDHDHDARENDNVVLRDDVGDHDVWELEPEPQPTRRPGVDPLLARLGGLAVIVTLAAPLVVGFTASGSDAQSADSRLASISATATTAFADVTTTVASAAAAPAAPASTDMATTVAPAGSTSDVATTVVSESIPPDATDPAPQATAPSTAAAAPLQDAPDPAPAETAPQVTTSPCGGRYELAAGDYWIRIADAAGVSLAELLSVNDSSIDTVLVPGRSICLPVGAATPSPPPPPTTVAPAPAPTTAAPTPSTTAAPKRPATVAAAATTSPTTTAPSRPAAVPQSQAASIIRDVWPDELEDRALEIAWRESNHQSNVNNYCCYGLFQIHWTAHRGWLATLGVTSAAQLFDPVVNANAAYTLYQRSGGFGPWGG